MTARAFLQWMERHHDQAHDNQTSESENQQGRLGGDESAPAESVAMSLLRDRRHRHRGRWHALNDDAMTTTDGTLGAPAEGTLAHLRQIARANSERGDGGVAEAISEMIDRERLHVADSRRWITVDEAMEAIEDAAADRRRDEEARRAEEGIRRLLERQRAVQMATPIVGSAPRATFYILDARGTPVVETNAQRWQIWMTHAPNRFVGQHELADGTVISTAFTGASTTTPPMLWQTAIFRAGQPSEFIYYAEREVAEDRHAYYVREHSGQRAIRLRD